MELIRSDIQLPFANYFRPALFFSAFLVVLSLVFLVYRIFVAKDFNWGTEFSGGIEIHAKFVDEIHENEIREALKGLGFGDSEVVRFGGTDTQEFLIRLNRSSSQGESLATQMSQALVTKFGEGKVNVLQVDEVGAKVGRDLKKSAVISFLIANLGIWLYIWFRFTPSYAPGAVLAHVHDIIITLGIYSLAGFPFDLATVAAILTLIGYSVNDTIVIFDRIRDNLRTARRGNFLEVVVGALNQTLSRTIITSSLTFAVVFALCIFSQGSIRGFSFFMSVGIFLGTYSSLFVATPILIWCENRARLKATASGR